MSMFIYLLSTYMILAQLIYTCIAIAVFTMDGQYQISRINFKILILEKYTKQSQIRWLDKQSDQGLFVNLFLQINH